MTTRSVYLRSIVGAAALLLSACSKQDSVIQAGPDFEKRLQEALIAAKPGQTIEIGEGKHSITRGLSLSVANVTLKGKGMDKSILSFKEQKTGSVGLSVSANGFTVEDLAIEDTKGDAIKVANSENVTFRRFRTEWTNGANPKNGAYGMYPVSCKNVLIEDSVAKGASDAGIYVGQSENIIVRRNKVELNVAGLEIENSASADVYENIITNNTGGLFVLDLPNLPRQNGNSTRVYKNQIFANNTTNFAPGGNIAGTIPAGTGLIVLATRKLEVFDNDIKDNLSANISIVSYLTTGNPIKDQNYNPYVSAVSIHDNRISGGGTKPDKAVAEIAKAVGSPVPSIIYDGFTDPKMDPKQSGKLEGDNRICVRNNGDAAFVNYSAPTKFKTIDRDLKNYECTLPALSPISLPGAANGKAS
jgi:parallel beta-helix repeat protein